MDLFIGVDAGGTRTRAVLADATGVVLGAGEGGAGNFQAVGGTAAREAIRSAVSEALARAGGAPAAARESVSAQLIRGGFFGLAGVRTEAERATMRAEILKLGLGGVAGIGSDVEVAHAGALAGGPGVVVIAGTGSAAWGKNAAGEIWQAGGWGWLVDDKGGGCWLATQGLAAACEGEDGRGPATTLGTRAAVFFGAGLREVLRELHAGKRDRTALAGFAREVRAAADAGDAVAAGLVRAAGAELLRLAEAVKGKIAPGERAFPLAVTGGLGMGAAIAEAARAEDFDPVEPWGEPVIGAVLLAARAGGAELDAAARKRLLATWKPTA